jgi:rRNA maturation endonuclease Nob1
LQRRGIVLARKGLSVWLFSSMTFVAAIHLIDATSALLFNNPIKMLQLYPLISGELQGLTPITYFWISAAVSLILWGITCAIAFENPVETFLNKVLSDAKSQSAVEDQLLERKSEVLDAMYETMESSNGALAQIKDMVCNVRVDVKEIQPLKENMERMKAELIGLKKEFRKIDDRVQPHALCPTCSKPLLPEFKVCPYCGENIRLLPEKLISVKDYR